MADMLSNTLLDEFVGVSIADICPLKFGKAGDVHNHCADFVSHVLKLNAGRSFGLTCAGMVFGGKNNLEAGGCIRVNDIFNHSADIAGPDDLGCLAYYTVKSNMKDGWMGDMKKKHVGICYKGSVWNYGNTKDEVRRDKVGDLKNLYGKNTITLYTAFPIGAVVLSLSQITAQAK